MIYGTRMKNMENQPADKAPVLCGMDAISRDGKCNRPDTHIWTNRDGETPVCNRCVLCVLVSGGKLTEIPNNSPKSDT
jgi:hypothetical protein